MGTKERVLTLLGDDTAQIFSYDGGTGSSIVTAVNLGHFRKEKHMSIALSSGHPGSRSTRLARPSARSENPKMDRRAHTERRAQMKAMPGVDQPWTRHAILAGCLGAFLGSAGALAILEQRSFKGIDQAAERVKSTGFEPATAAMAPLFDTQYFPPTALKAGAVQPVPQAGSAAETYSEEAPFVPGATYHEPSSAGASPSR